MQHSSSANSIPKDSAMLVLYGSQTGSAEGIARRLFTLLSSPSCYGRIFCMDQYDVQNLKKETARVIFVISTFATGDFPDNAQSFWRNLTKGDWNGTSLTNLQYTVFGLGNSHSHEHYNAAAKMLDKRLLELGSKHFYIVGQSNELDDDSHDTAFIPWVNGLKVKMRGSSTTGTLHKQNAAALAALANGPPRVPSDESLSRPVPYTVYMLPDQRPCVPGYTMVQLASNTLITPKDFDRGVYYCELSLEDTPLKYKLCDYVAILPRNKRGLVDGFMEHLNLSGDTMVVITPQHGGVPLKIPQPVRLRDLFESYLDLFSRPTKYLMSVFATYASNEEEKKILQRISAANNNSEWELFHREQYTIADVLLSYSSIHFGLSELVSYIPLMKPRLYSICSSPKEHSHRVFFVYSHRNWKTPSGRTIKGGVCTNFMTQLNPLQESLAIAIKRGTIKYSHKQADCPLVFMALGTGVGTALAILRERKNMQLQGIKLAPMALYFSVRNKDKDFIFAEELNSYLASGVLTHLVTTFAYDTQPPQFIQVKIKEDPALMWSYLQREKCLYIYCGLGGSIPDEIEDCIRTELAPTAKKSVDELREHIRNMKHQKRWIVENHTTISQKTSPAEALLQSTELHEEISFSAKDSKVTGGTPRRLVEWIASKGDLFDISALLLTYRKYLDTVDMLHAFRDLYASTIEAADVKTINNLLLFLRQWATQYYRADFRSNELKQEFWQVVETMAIPKNELTHSLSGVLTREGSSLLSPSQSTLFPTSPSQNDLEHKKLHRLSKHYLVTDFDEDMVFTELDFRICSEFAQIQTLELVDVAWQKKDKEKLAPNVLRLIRTFNDTSGWIATEILTAPSSKQQTAVIVHFIKIAAIAVEKRNFDLVMAILSGLTNYSVSRCHCLWDAVPAKMKDKLEQVQEIMKIDNNFKRYRDLLHAAPAMPYFALILRDLAFAEENTDYFENGLINFEKSRILYSIVKDFQSMQRTPSPPSYGGGSGTPNKTVINLKEFLSHLDVLDDQELYTHSVVIEPQRSTQRRNSKIDFISQVGVSLFNNCMANNVNAVKNLLKENVVGDVVKYHNQHGETALHICASEGFTKLVRILLESGADVNAQNSAGNTALHLSSSNNHLKVAKVLVESGADIMKVNEEKKSSIDVATPRVKSYLEVEKLRPLISQMSRKSLEIERAVVWNETMSVGVKLFDKDHMQLIDAINLVLSMNENSYDAIGNVLDFLMHYTEFHFANEETLFAKYNYPQSTSHKKEHIRLTEQVKQYNKLHRKGKVTNQELTKFLQGWLINHIMKEDMKYTEFFHSKGVY